MVKLFAKTPSPFICSDPDFIKRSEKKAKNIKRALKLLLGVLLGMLFVMQGAVLLYSFSCNIFIIAVGVFDLIFGGLGIIWFGFLFTDAIHDFKKERR